MTWSHWNSWRWVLAVGCLLAWGASAVWAAESGSISGLIDTDAVMNAVYGEQPDGAWKWVVPADAPTEPSQDLRGRTVDVRPLMSAHFLEQGSERFLVVTSLIDPQQTCHGCEGLIGAVLYVLDARDAHWHPGVVAPALDLVGNSGLPPEVSFEQLGPDVYGFGVRDKYTGTGETDDWLTLWRAGENRFSKLLRVHLLMSEERLSEPSTSDCAVTRNDVRVLRESRNGLFDLGLSIRKSALHSTDASVDACGLPLGHATDFKQADTVFHYDPVVGRYCQAVTLAGVERQAPPCRR